MKGKLTMDKNATKDIIEILIASPIEYREKIIENEEKLKTKQQAVLPGKVKSKPQVKKKIKYCFDAINCNCDLESVTKKLLKSKVKQYGILLYGVSGAGKSMWAEYLAQELNMPYIKKRASDLMGAFVGQSEANIAKAFEEAREAGAVLVIDEADSFLFDRSKATQSHQVSSVNELLTQMEDYPYPFIMTTNLKSKIDSACFRRFIFKIKFDYMTEKNVIAAIKEYFGKTIELTKEEVKELKHLAAGDFKVAKQKLDILENKKYTRKNIISYLKQEIAEKNIPAEIEPSKSMILQ